MGLGGGVTSLQKLARTTKNLVKRQNGLMQLSYFLVRTEYTIAMTFVHMYGIAAMLTAFGNYQLVDSKNFCDSTISTNKESRAPCTSFQCSA